MPAVSVILPTCDRPDLWPRALASLLRQAWGDFEVLLVDSNRQTPPLREHPGLAAGLADRRVRLLEPRGIATAAAARNCGLKAAQGEWITYLDDDDVYHPEKLSSQILCARQSKAAIVLCGYTVVLPRRRRVRQTARNRYSGDELLTDATWGTPFLFHRRDSTLTFDESLAAGEDEVFAQAFLAAHDVRVVPNCARSLVEVFPQLARTRVHANADAQWRACRVCCRRARPRYSPAARRAYLATGRLVRAQAGHGSLAHFMGCVCGCFALRGPRAWRLVANASAKRAGVLKRWVVS